MNLSLFIVGIDQRVQGRILATNPPWLQKTFRFITHFADGAIWIIVYIAAFLLDHNWFYRVVLPIIIAEMMGLVIIIGLRYAVKRDRPGITYIAHWLAPWNQYSFPSHHSLRAFIIAVVIGSKYQQLFLPLVLLASLISLSRIWLAKHYLSDVITGALLGLLLAEISMEGLLKM